MKIYFLPTVSISIQKKRSRDFTLIMITKRGNSLILYQILSTNSVRKCVEFVCRYWGFSINCFVCKQNHVTKHVFVHFHSLLSCFLSWTFRVRLLFTQALMLRVLHFIFLLSIVHWPQSSLSYAY